MKKFYMYLVLVSALFFNVSATKLPDNFKRCNLKDKSCLIEAVQDALPKLKGGIPELGVPSLDPLSIPKMSIGGGKIVDLVQNYDNAEVSGFGDAKIKDITLDLDQGKLTIDLSIGLALMNASYSIKGKILFFEVYGSGKSFLSLENPWGKLTVDLETYTKNNQIYIKGKHQKLTMNCERASFKFENLFDGNAQLGDNINNVLNENWREVFDEVQQGYADVFAASLTNVMNKLFAKIPVTELFLDQ